MTRGEPGGHLPQVAVLELTYRCPHSCLFCSCPWERPGGGFARLPELGTGAWTAVVDGLVDDGVSRFALTGGEPTLREDLEAIVGHLASTEARHPEPEGAGVSWRQGPPELTLLTCGRSLPNRLTGLLASVGAALSVSLPGLSTYRTLTGGGDPDRALEAIRRASSKGLRVTANIAVTAPGLDELDRTIAAALLAGASGVLLNRFLPGGRGLANRERLELDRGRVVRMLETAEEVLSRAGRRGSVGTEIPPCVARQEDYPSLSFGSRCSAATGFFVVGPSGWVRACNHSELRLAMAGDREGLRASDVWMAYRRGGVLPRECLPCRHMGGCDGGCREVARILTGSVRGPDPLVPGSIRVAATIDPPPSS